MAKNRDQIEHEAAAAEPVDASSGVEDLMAGETPVAAGRVDEVAPPQVATVRVSSRPRGEMAAPNPRPAKGRTSVDYWLRGLLVFNLALMCAALLVPVTDSENGAGTDPGTPADQPASTSESGDAVGERRTPGVPGSRRAPRNVGAIRHNELWDRAVLLAGKGEYAAAVSTLKDYIRLDKAMADPVRRLVYNQIAFYLVKDGRLDEALEFERMSNQLMVRSHLPEDLLQSARNAEKAADVHGIRASYARFLLQQKQIPPSLRRSVAEAYLRIGDAYRIEAKRGEAAANQAGAGSSKGASERDQAGHEQPASATGSHAQPKQDKGGHE